MARPFPFISAPRSVVRFGSRLLLLSVLVLAQSAGFAQETYKWSVQYLIDNSQSMGGQSQAVYPRNNRGLAISPDGKYLYAAYLHSFNHSGEVRRIRLDEADYEQATLHILPGILPKAIAVDPEGRVYIAESDQIAVYDSRLRQFQFGIDQSNCEGMAVIRQGGKLVLYATARNRGVLTRWELETKGDLVIGASAKGLENAGEIKIPEAKSLRGVAVDSKGRVWMADLAGNKIFRVSSEGKGLESKEILSPNAMAFDADRCFITQERERQITIMDLDMKEIGTLKVPWEDLALAPLGNNRLGTLAGIVMVPGKGFFVSNEAGQTAGQCSTYGKEDGNSGVVGGKTLQDTKMDDNDPILRATLEPSPKP